MAKNKEYKSVSKANHDFNYINIKPKGVVS